MAGKVINMTLLKEFQESTGCSATSNETDDRFAWIYQYVAVYEGCQGEFQVCYSTTGKEMQSKSAGCYVSLDM